MQYTYPSLGTMLYANQAEPLARTYKLGFWYDTESFADQQFDNTGLSLANPASNGMPMSHRGNFGIYAVADQLVWVDPHESDRTINLFARVMGAPQADRNLVTFSMNAGLTFHEPFLHRDDDTFGIGMGFTKVSGSAAALDKATGVLHRRLRPDPRQRDLRGADLPIPGRALVAAPTRPPVRVHARRRHRQSKRAHRSGSATSWCSACAPTSCSEGGTVERTARATLTIAGHYVNAKHSHLRRCVQQQQCVQQQMSAVTVAK